MCVKSLDIFSIHLLCTYVLILSSFVDLFLKINLEDLLIKHFLLLFGGIRDACKNLFYICSRDRQLASDGGVDAADVARNSGRES